MFNSVVIFGQSLNPSGQNTFGTLESLQPLETVVISPKDDFSSKEVVSEMLQGNYNGQQLTTSGTVILLSAI